MGDNQKNKVAFNPFRSFVITASAGCGKTHQLVNRYLHLAAVLGDSPLSRILTVTFTRKAAAEMHQRIIEKAAAVLALPREKERLETSVSRWSKTGRRPEAAAVANRILRNSQSMRVVTMDSLFSSLTSRFALEAGLPAAAEIAGADRLTEICRTAWYRLLNDPEFHEELRRCAELLEGEIGTIEDFLSRLYLSYRPSLCLRFRQEGRDPLLDLILKEENIYSASDLAADLRALLSRALPELPDNTPRRRELIEELAELLADGGLEEIVSSRFFKPLRERWIPPAGGPARFSVSRSAFKDKKTASRIDACLEKYYRFRGLRRYNRLMESLIKLYRGYEKTIAGIKKELGLIDFADVSLGAFRLMEDPGIAFTFQSGVQHLLIDEFQDTSRLQWEIFRPVMEELVAGSGMFDNQSFLAVGDQKQSIYGFREADYTLLSDLAELAGTIPDLDLLPLHKSFRSSRLIIEAVNTVFEKAPLPSFRKHVTALPPTVSSVTVYPLIEREEGDRQSDRWRLDARRVAVSIQCLVESKVPVTIRSPAGEYRQRPIRYGDIAVLYRKKKPSSLLESELVRRAIPCRREEPGGFYQRREIQDILAFLDFLCDPDDDTSLAVVLRSPLIGLSEKEFAELLASRRPGQPLRGAFRERFQDIRSAPLWEALEEISSRPAVEVLEDFLQKADARLRYLITVRDELPVLNLDKMIDLLGALPARGMGSIRQLRQTIRKLSEEDETRMAGEAGDSVRLMTIHKAKGLEFKAVYLFDAANPGPAVGRSASFELLRKPGPGVPPVIYFSPASCRPEGHPVFEGWIRRAQKESEKEELRLLYVALTRAAQHLFISGIVPHHRDGGNYDLLVASFKKLAEGGEFQRAAADPAGQNVLISLREEAFLPEAVSPPPPKKEEIDETIFIQPPPAGETIFVRPADAGRQEKKDSDPIPQGAPDLEKYRALGLAVHRALEAEMGGRPFCWDSFLDGVLGRRHPDRHWVEKELSADLKKMAALNLPVRLAGAEIKTEVPVLARMEEEKGLSRIITGTIDLLAVFPGRVEFYDYKTARRGEEPAGETGNNYRKQMKLYRHVLNDIYNLPVEGKLILTVTGKIIEMEF